MQWLWKAWEYPGAMTTQSTGTESKLCSAASVQNPPHPALLQAVPAPGMVPCPFCSEKLPAPGSPCLPACPDTDGLFPPHYCSPAPLACGGAPFPGGQAERAQGTQCTSSKADDYSSVIPSSLPDISPLPTCTLPTTDIKHPHSGLQGPESAAVNRSGSKERHDNGVSQPLLLQRVMG